MRDVSEDRKGDNMISSIFEEQLTIELDKVLLRPITADDAEDLYDIFSDKQVMKYYDRLPLKSREEADDLAKMFMDGLADKTMIRWGIEEKAGGKLIGTCGFFCISEDDKKVEIGYELRRDRWGMGIMSEALGAIMKFIFTRTDINRVEAFVEVQNVASMRLLDKLGFVNEGTLRQYERCRNELIDVTIWSCLRSDGVY